MSSCEGADVHSAFGCITFLGFCAEKKMSKSATAREFRKVDVDKFDEDVFQDDQAEEEQDLGPSESEIQQLLMSYPLPCSTPGLGPTLLYVCIS